jgi:two-component system, OmpR family, phosphate regulon sensor histidine kinase PhoR
MRGIRVRTLFILAGLMLLALAGLAAWLAAGSAVREQLAGVLPPDQVAGIVNAVRASILAAVTLAGSVALLLLFMAGTRMAGVLARLRQVADAGTGPPPQSGVEELNALAEARVRQAGELRTRAELLEAQRDELVLLLDTVSDGILRLGPGARIMLANRAARALLGLPDGVYGQTVPALVRHVELRRLLERAAEGEEVPPCDIELDERRVLLTARPFAGGAVVALADFTEIRRLEGVRRDFVANASHELKTPLTSIRGYAETLLTDEVPGDMARQFLETIHKNAERLQRIIEDLLDLSRLESGSFHPQVEPVDAVAVAAEVWAGTFRQRAERRGISFTCVQDAPPVRADPLGLRQIYTNLFDNALRHTTDRGDIRVSVRSAARPGFVAIEVTDTGTGIPSDALPRIFERFYRVDPARSRAEGGTGLGLAIVRHWAEGMGGEVSADSELGKGTTVRVVLPLADTRHSSD